MTKNRQHAYLALLIVSIIWGSAFPIVKPVFAYLTPLQYLYFRFLVAGLASLPIFLYFYLKIRPKVSKIIKLLIFELLGAAIPLLILYEGLAKTSALEASLIGATGPIFVVLGGIWFLHERESKKEWQGLALSLLGSLILVIAPVLLRGQDTLLNMTGNLYILFYNLLYAIYAVAVKKIYKSKPILYLGSLTYFGTALIYGLILYFQNALPNYELLTINHVLFPVLYMAIPGSILSFALYLYAQSKIEVSEANLFTYLNGIVAIPAAYLLLGEKPSLLTLLAILIIAWGVYRGETRTK